VLSDTERKKGWKDNLPVGEGKARTIGNENNGEGKTNRIIWGSRRSPLLTEEGNNTPKEPLAKRIANAKRLDTKKKIRMGQIPRRCESRTK